MNASAVIPMPFTFRGRQGVCHGSIVMTNLGLDASGTHGLTHLVGRFFVTAFVLAVLAFTTLVTVIGAAVAASPSRLDVAMLDGRASLVVLLVGHCGSFGEWEVGFTPHLDLAQTLSRIRNRTPVIP